MIQYRGFLVMQWLVERLPRRLGYALAVAVARFAFLFARNARDALMENLEIALPDLSHAELRQVTWHNFRNHSKAYADLMRLPVARVEDLRAQLRIQGMEHLEAARARGRGVLVVSAHMGSWEVAAAIWSATVAPVSLFAEELEPLELGARLAGEDVGQPRHHHRKRVPERPRKPLDQPLHRLERSVLDQWRMRRKAYH